MSIRLKEVSHQIDILKTKLSKLWDETGCTNDEILKVSEEIDVLLNEYDRLLQLEVRVS